MNLVHLTSSTFFGGPERQMLGLAKALPESTSTTFVSFSECGRNREFLAAVERNGFPAVGLKADFPHPRSTLRELVAALDSSGAEIVLCHGYKANIFGRIAARKLGIPAVAVSRGWTGENRKVKFYEWLDRRHLSLMDHVVCVSEGQAAKVRCWCNVSREHLSVIHNSARLEAFAKASLDSRQILLDLFPREKKIERIVIAAGRLSPEKGFGVLVEAAATITKQNPEAGIVLFGEGVLRSVLERRIAALDLTGRVVMPGFRADLDTLIPAADVVVLPSFTEGLPNVALEASAAGVPVVATAVGGTPEVIADRENGILVPSGNTNAIAAAVRELLASPELSRKMGDYGRLRMQSHFTFASQAEAYQKLFAQLLSISPRVRHSQTAICASPRMGVDPIRELIR